MGLFAPMSLAKQPLMILLGESGYTCLHCSIVSAAISEATPCQVLDGNGVDTGSCRTDDERRLQVGEVVIILLIVFEDVSS